MNTSNVYLFNTWEARPVYHAYGNIAGSQDDGNLRDVTACGLLMYDRETRYRALLRQGHADLFARPCRKCFDVPAVREEPK